MEAHVSPYIIFSDKTLTELCILQPATEEEMLQVSGVGRYKFAQYGEVFLKAIREANELFACSS